MANRSITVTLRANVQDFKSQFDAATRAADQTAKATEESAKRADTAMGRMVQSAQENREAWNTAGATLTGFGAAVLGGLGLATKAAMDWESAWAGVQKTVDGTAPQMEALEAGLRGMARELPASHQEIAAVAEAAGQLGIATPNILGFTRTMIDMGEATNLSADEAATALARFITVTGTSQQDIGRLGATVVGLGNNFATTEAEIVELSQRLAAAGTQAGMSEGEIMGMATAMSQVGIEAEAGGSAMTQSLNRMAKSVEEGGESLELFAAVSGMTAEQFTAAWENDPAQALVAFTEGLADTSALGMSTNAVLTELGITGLREADVMRRLALATGTMSDAMAMGNAEFEAGTALIEEASKRYETAESRIAMARNALVDSAISIGGVVLPAFAGLADGVAETAGWFADLPEPVHAAAGGLGAVAGAASLGAGAFLLVVPRVLDTVSAFRDLGAISPGTASKVGRTTLAIGKVGLAAGAAAAVFPLLVSAGRAVEDSLRGVDEATRDLGMNELTSKLLDAADSGDVLNAVMGDMYESGAINTSQFENLGVAVQKVSRLDTDIFARTGRSLNLTNGYLLDAEERLNGLGEALTLMANTDLPSAQEAFSAFWAEAQAGGASLEEVFRVLPGFRDALAGVALEMGVGTDDATLLRIATGELAPVMDDTAGAAGGLEEGLSGVEQAAADATSALDDHLSALTDVADAFLASRDATRKFEDALADAYELLEENDGAHWGDGTEGARELEEAIDGVAGAYLRELEAARTNGDSTAEIMQDRRDDIIALGEAYNIPQDELNEYLELIGLTPEAIEQTIVLETLQAKADWAALWDEVGHHSPEVPVGADTGPAEDSLMLFEDSIVSSDPALAPVGADTSGAQEEITIWGSQVGDVPTRPVQVTADTDAGEATLRAFQGAVNDAGGTVDINGDTMYADEALDVLIDEVNAGNGEVTINGTTFPANTSLMALVEAINLSDGTVTIEGNNKPANDATDAAERRANRASGTIKVNASTSSANSAINHAARTRYSTISVSYSVRGGVPQMNFGNGTRATARAGGGPVFGPGTETSDSIHAKLSHNEHVFAAREVKAAGGHQAIYSLRQQLMSGAKTIHLATGGAADGSVGAVRSLPMVQQARASVGSVTAQVDQVSLEAAVVRGMSSAHVVAQVSDRVAANLYQRGKSGSRAYGGAK